MNWYLIPQVLCSASGLRVLTKCPVSQTHKDLPAFLLASPSLSLSLVLGSSGPTPGSIVSIGNLEPVLDPTAKALLEKQKLKDLGEGIVVYKAKEEIRHVFRADPQSPPKIITLVFLLAVLTALGGLFVVVSTPAYAGQRLYRKRIKVNRSSSGFLFSAETSLTFPGPSNRPQSHTQCSLAACWPWKVSSSCTTLNGTSSRPSPECVLWGLLPS